MAHKTKAGNKAGRFSPLVARWLRLCVAALTASDDDRRHQAVATVLQMAEPPLLRLLIDRLVRRLQGRDDVARRQAARSLAGLGEAAVSALSCELLKSRDAETQVLLVEALAAIGKSLPRPRRTDIQMTLAIAQARTTSPEVMAAVARADQEFRPPVAEPGRPTGPG